MAKITDAFASYLKTSTAATLYLPTTWSGSTNISTLGTITNGTWSGTTIALANGGTGATTADTARTNLGLAIGTNVQAYAADLSAIAGLAGTSGLLKKTAANTWALDTTTYLTSTWAGSTNISTLGTITSGTWSGTTIALANGGTGATTAANARTNLGLVIGTNVQAWDGDLDAISALAGTSGLLKKTAANTWTLDSATYLTGITSGQITTALGFTPENAINKGQANGYAGLDGTGKVPSTQLPSYLTTAEAASTYLTTATAASTYLSIASASGTYQPLDADLTSIAGLAGTTGVLKKTAANTWALDTSTYLTSYTETDPVYTASTWYTTTNNSTNWNTAYGWGNHENAGYLTTAEAASTYLTIASASGTYQPLDADLTSIAGLAGTTGVLKKTAANTWALDTSTYLTSYTETDPVYTASTWYTTTNNSANWNTAYGWGNHENAGYLTTAEAASTYLTTATAASTYLTIASASGTYQPLDADLTSIAGLAGTTGVLKKTAANTWALDTSTYLTSYTETDPVYTASTWYTTTNNSTNWNTAYGWGNHSSAGYLLSSTASSTYQPLDADLTSIASLTGTSGFLKTNGSGTWAVDTNTYLTGNQNISLSGDATGSGTTSISITLVDSGVTAASYTYANITVDAKGRVTSASSGTAPVTSVGVTSPIATSGGTAPTLSLASGYGDTQNPYASKTGNYVLATPDGSSGPPVFRALVSSDIPTLNQNTTGTASNVTGTVAVANGGTGSISLPANNVILGNGTSAVQTVAPGTTGNLLTSTGTTWTSSALVMTRYMEIIAVSKTTAMTNGTDIIGAIEIPVTGTITNIRAKTASGTATITFNKNASSIGSVSATTSGVSSSVSSSVTANDLLTLDISSASGSGLVVTITIVGN